MPNDFPDVIDRSPSFLTKESVGGRILHILFIALRSVVYDAICDVFNSALPRSTGFNPIPLSVQVYGFSVFERNE